MKKKTSPRKKNTARPVDKHLAARGKKKTTGPQLKHVAWSRVEPETLNPLLQRQMMVGQEVMLTRILLKTGCVVPLHSHHNEQLSYVLEGSLRFSIDGRDIVVNAGEVMAIPPHMPHRVEALADSLSLDIFNPPRQDWLSGTDQYLRGAIQK
jgi:quercetin dioxygenase-like cupin family protein